jgi:hypothetical protein
VSFSILLPTLLLTAPLAGAQETWRPDDTVINALSAQVTDEGFDALGDAAVEALPGLLAGQDLLDLGDVGGVILNAKPSIGITSLDIQPKVPGSISVGAEIEVDLVGTLALNSPQDPYTLQLLICDGPGHLAPTRIEASARLQITVQTTGTPPNQQKVFKVDLTVLPNSIKLGQLQLRGECATLLNIVGDALKDVLIDALLGNLLGSTITDLETTLEEALQAAFIKQEVDALGKTLFIDLSPRQLKTTADGLELIYDAKFTAAQDPCVADDDPLGSLKTSTPIPPIGANPPGTQIAAYVSDDMLNQALYAAYSGGVLCITVDESLLGDSLPIAIDSSLVPLLAGQEYAALLPETPQELIIRTRPKRVPQVNFQGQRPLTLELREFGIDLYTDMEGRKARIVGIEADADVGVDADFDDTTGALSILGLEDLGSAFTFTVVGDVFIPGTEPNLVEGLGGLLETVLPLALGGLTDSLSFTLPSFGGLGLDRLVLGAGGQQGDWLRAEAGIGAVTYGDAGAGCDGSGGCSGGGCGGGCGGTDGSCGGGCSAAGFNLGTGLGVLLPLWALRRRRSRA